MNRLSTLASIFKAVSRRLVTPSSKAITAILVATLLLQTNSDPRLAISSRVPDNIDNMQSTQAVEIPTPPVAAPAAIDGVRKHAYGTTTKNPDGSYTTELSPRPVHWKDPNTGQWRDFDNTIREIPAERSRAGFGWENSANGFSAGFAGEGDAAAGRSLARIAAPGGQAISMALQGARPGAGQRQGSEVTYQGAFPGVDVRYTVDGDRLKEDIILQSAGSVQALMGPAGTLSFTFDLALDGLSATQRSDGSIAFSDGDGRVQFIMPRPFMVDSSTPDTPRPPRKAKGNEPTPEVVVSLMPTGTDSVRLILSPNTAWLLDERRVDPVMLDPTTTLVTEIQPNATTGKDAYMQEAINTNFGTSVDLRVGKEVEEQCEEGGGCNNIIRHYQSLLQFSGFDTLAQGMISSASLSLYATSQTGGATTVYVREPTASWTESTIHWNNKPATGSEYTSLSVSGGGWKGFDLSSVIRSWMYDEVTSYGFYLQDPMSGSCCTAPQVTFASSDYATASFRPKLVFTHTLETRYGMDSHWTYGPTQSYGGGTTGQVNLSTGNLVVQHADTAIPARGFDVAISHTYNSQDVYGSTDETQDPNAWVDPGDYFGAGWTMSYNIRLVEYDSGNAVRIKDGTGQWRVYYKDIDNGNTRTYKRPLYFGHTLTKDLAIPPTDANKVFTFTAEKGLIRYHFTADGKLTKIEERPNGNGNYLSFGYETGTDKLTTVTDVAGRNTTLAYSGTPPLLSTITDMAGRVSSYGYSNGRLTSITHAYGTADAVTTSFGYDAAGQLVDITNPRGHTANVTYKYEHEWNTGGSTESWGTRSGCTGSTVSQSTAQAFMGAGSLALGFSSSTCGGAKKTISPAGQMSPIRQQLVGYLYVPAGATDVTARFYVKDRLGSVVNGTSFTSFTANAWNRIHWIDAAIDPSNPPTEIGVEVTRGTALTATLYFDQLFMRGVTYQQKDALAAHNVMAEYSYALSSHLTTVKGPDQDGVLRNRVYSYNQWGWPITEMEGDGFDTFDRPDGLLTAASSPSGHTWTAESGSSIKVESNLVRQDNGAVNKIAYIDVGSSIGGNVTLTAQVRNAVSAKPLVGFAVRVVDTSNYLYIAPTMDNGVKLYKKVSGTVTLLSSYTYPELNTNWHDLRMVAQDGTIEVWVNGTKRITHNLNSSDYTTFSNTVSKHGIFVTSDTTAWMDDFAVSSRLTASTYDADGRLTRRTPPPPEEGTSTWTTYNYHSNTNFLSSVTNRNGGTTKYGVDTANGDQRWVVSPRQSGFIGASPYTASYFVRDSAGNVLQERKAGYPISNVQPDTLEDKIYSVTAYEYYPSTGLKSTMVDPMGHITRYDYDGGSRDKGYLTRTELPPYGLGGAARVTTYVRNADGSMQQETDPTGRITTYEYDNLGRLKQTNYGVVSGTPTYSVSQTYDANGNVATSTDGRSKTTTFTYDANNRLLSVLDANSKTTTYEYYVNGLLKKIIDPLLRESTFTYDRKDQLLTEKDALNNTTTYKYDARGNVIKKTNPSGSSITYKYDAGDRLTGEGSTTFAYNADNNRTSMVDGTGTTNYSYDSLGQLTLVDQPGTSAADFAYTYDQAGRLTSRGFIASGDRTVHYSYLPGGLLGVARAPFMYPGTTVTTYSYDAAGRPTLTKLPNNTTASYSYDSAGRLTLVENKSSTGTVISRHAYTLDGAGNRTAADEDNGATLDGITNYTYDNLNRLTEAVYPDNQQVGHRRVTYAYNDSGDRTSMEKWTGIPGSWAQYGTTSSYTYDGAGRLTAAVGANHCFDANGNQTRRNGTNCTTGGDTFSWNAWDRMTRYTPSAGTLTDYTYNGDWVRTKKTTGSTITEYYQDVAGDLPRVAADKTGTVWNYYVYGSGNSLVGKVGSDNVARYYHHDGTGHVRAITDSTGAVVERYDYDAFGALRNTPTGLSNDRRYTGEQHDAETAYTYLRARYYDPALGRFISKDPLPGSARNPQTLNGYVYVVNNPVNLTDPGGKCWDCFFDLAFIAYDIFTGDWEAAAWDTAGLFIPGATGLGMVKRAGRAIERHHLLPRQFQARFEAAGLNVEDFTIDLPKERHRLRPDGVHTGDDNWNKRWEDFFASYDEAGTTPTADEILEQMESMKKEFELP